MDSDYTIFIIIIVMLYLASVIYLCINKHLLRKICTNNIPTKNNTNIINNKGRISDVVSPIYDNNDNDAKLSLSTIEF